VFPFNVLHGDKVNAVDLVEVEDRADVWVIEVGGKLRFALETLEIGFAGGKFRGQHLDDERAAKLRVDGFIDCSLSALTELLKNLIVPQRRTDHLNVVEPPNEIGPIGPIGPMFHGD